MGGVKNAEKEPEPVTGCSLLFLLSAVIVSATDRMTDSQSNVGFGR